LPAQRRGRERTVGLLSSVVLAHRSRKGKRVYLKKKNMICIGSSRSVAIGQHGACYRRQRVGHTIRCEKEERSLAVFPWPEKKEKGEKRLVPTNGTCGMEPKRKEGVEKTDLNRPRQGGGERALVNRGTYSPNQRTKCAKEGKRNMGKERKKKTTNLSVRLAEY